MLVGPDGETLIKGNQPEIEFRAGGLRFSTPLTPDTLLSRAVQGARRMAADQAYQQSMRLEGSAWAAQQAAQVAAASVSDPFILEPAAMAVFMYLSREIEFRDRVLSEINERLTRLGVDPINLRHPYPYPEPNATDDAEEGTDDEH